MADLLFQAFNAAMPTTAAPVKVTTGTAIKTLLQLSPPSTLNLSVIEWGISFDGSPAAIQCELVETDVAATVTAYVANDITKTNQIGGGAFASKLTLGTANSGFTASAEGSTTATRMLDAQIVSANQYWKQWPMGREPIVQASKFLRIRVTAAAAVNATCYVVWAEH